VTSRESLLLYYTSHIFSLHTSYTSTTAVLATTVQEPFLSHSSPPTPPLSNEFSRASSVESDRAPTPPSFPFGAINYLNTDTKSFFNQAEGADGDLTFLDVDQDIHNGRKYSIFSPSRPETTPFTDSISFFNMAPSSAPIEISRSSPPGSNKSNLTSQLEAVSSDQYQNHPRLFSNGGGNGLQPDSYSYSNSFSKSRPINMNGKSSRKPSQQAGSFMGGMSWGGMSVGSFIRDE